MQRNWAIAEESLGSQEGIQMPKGKKHTPEQIITILRRIDSGEAAQAVCRETV